jgi:hypothetical protein
LFIKGEESQAQVYLDKAFNFADNHQDLLQVQVLRLFYNAFLLGRAFCESSLKRVHNCH